MLPEIFLSLAVFSILMIGVFIKNSFNLIFNLTSLIIIVTILILLTGTSDEEKIFLNSYIRDAFSNYFKILILLSSLFVLNSSKNFIIDNKLDKFEYPIIILLSILGMFFMVSSNDLILFYLGLELQSLSLYILASIDRDNLRSTESGIKYFVLSALSSGLLLYGCSLLYGFTGSTNFELISSQLNKENTGAVFAMVFILVGLAFKVSAVPFHMWTPDVYETNFNNELLCGCSKSCWFSFINKIYVCSFLKYFIRMANNYNLYIYCINDFRCCCSNDPNKF